MPYRRPDTVQPVAECFERQDHGFKIRVGLTGRLDQLLEFGATRLDRFQHGRLDVLRPDVRESGQAALP